MKDLKHIKRFNESEENWNISDVKSSKSLKIINWLLEQQPNLNLYFGNIGQKSIFSTMSKNELLNCSTSSLKYIVNMYIGFLSDMEEFGMEIDEIPDYIKSFK